MEIPAFVSLQENIKTAMRAREKEQLTALRMLHSELKNASTNAGIELTEAIFIDVVTRAVKQRRDAGQQYADAGRQDLADKEAMEVKLFARYLPAQLSRAEVETLARACVDEPGATSKRGMGQVMKLLMPKVKGQADGKMVNEIVGALLA